MSSFHRAGKSLCTVLAKQGGPSLKLVNNFRRGKQASFRYSISGSDQQIPSQTAASIGYTTLLEGLRPLKTALQAAGSGGRNIIRTKGYLYLKDIVPI